MRSPSSRAVVLVAREIGRGMGQDRQDHGQVLLQAFSLVFLP